MEQSPIIFYPNEPFEFGTLSPPFLRRSHSFQKEPIIRGFR